MPELLRAVVVVDYQNVHLTGHGVFAPGEPKHKCLIDPGRFGRKLIQVRNSKQRHAKYHADLSRVVVYRGLPIPEHDPDDYARNQAQKAEWMKDPLVEVNYRPLKYQVLRDRDGRPASDSNGRQIVKSKQEKGIDVLCALALVREAMMESVDLVILASQDTDLAPALEEAHSVGGAKIETVSWYEPKNYRSREIRSSAVRLWNTRLSESDFRACLDTRSYA